MPNQSSRLSTIIKSDKSRWIKYSTKIKSYILIYVGLKAQTDNQSTSKILIIDW